MTLRSFNDILRILKSGKSIVCITFPFLDKYGISQELQNYPVLSLDDCFRFLFSISKKSIDICSPFIDSAILRYREIIYDKIKANVKVRIAARELEVSPENPYGRLTSAILLLDPQNSGKLEVYKYHYTGLSRKLLSSIHAKFIVVDNEFGYVGSADIKEFSLAKNLEVGILTGEVNVINVLSAIFKELVRISTKLGNEYGQNI